VKGLLILIQKKFEGVIALFNSPDPKGYGELFSSLGSLVKKKLSVPFPKRTLCRVCMS
jgi:hypothetical protein